MEEILAAESGGAANEPTKDGFKRVCLRLGLVMIVVFVSRGVASVLLTLLSLYVDLGETGSYILQTVVSFLFLYIIPMVCTALLLKPPRSGWYKKPAYFGSALGMFPAFYGLAILVNVITLLTGTLITQEDINRSFNTVNELSPDNMTCAIILFVQLAVLAPIFEEYWFRGMVMQSLRPYGNGFAIFVSALLFGLTHANFQQFFYAFLIGIFLGYIAISTNSLVTTTVLHAMFNSISGIMLLFMADESVAAYLEAAQKGEPAESTPAVTVYQIFLFAVIMLLIVGLVMAVFKLIKIKRYKVPKVWGELSAAKRWGIFLSRFTVIIMLVLAADTFTFGFITNLAFKGICAIAGIETE